MFLVLINTSATSECTATNHEVDDQEGNEAAKESAQLPPVILYPGEKPCLA